jgi:hypothetical protein
MAIGTYSELKTAIADFAVRTDLTLQMDNFIALGEEAIYNGIGPIEPLRVTGMQTSITTGLPAFPSDFLEAIRLTTDVGGITQVVEYRTPEQFARVRNSGAIARFFTILGGQLLTVPTIGSYTLHYYKRFAALSGSNPTNYILTNAPSIYLYGSLMALFNMTRDPQKEEQSRVKFAAAMKALQDRDNGSNHSGSVLTVVPEVMVV